MSQHQPMTSLIAIIDWSSGRPQHQHFGSRRQPAFLFSVGSCAALVKMTMTLHDGYDHRKVTIVASYNLGRFRSRADSVHRLSAATRMSRSVVTCLTTFGGRLVVFLHRLCGFREGIAFSKTAFINHLQRPLAYKILKRNFRQIQTCLYQNRCMINV